MFGGKAEYVSLLCHESLAGVVIDRFGKDVNIMKSDEKTFVAIVEASISPVFMSWIMSFGKKVEVISPLSLKNKIKENAKEILEKYKK